MANWRDYLRMARARVAQLPGLFWLIGGVILVSAAAAAALELSGPPYAALYEGLSPEQGGKVIGALQKLGITYQLSAAGDVISVPAPQLAQARLQLGAAGVPGNDVSNGWDKLESAPMTTSDLAQGVMANQALENALEQSIESMAGIQSAQVYIATPPESAFLADQPKAAASVVIAADADAAAAQAKAIANLVSGAVPGLSADQVNVETTTGIVVNPSGNAPNTAAQLQMADQVQNAAAMRIAQLLTPIVGVNNFRASVSANIDFTREHIQRVDYGPAQIVSHQTSNESEQTGSQMAAIGIPGALSNEPPAATSAQAPVNPSAGAAGGSTAATDAAASQPRQNSRNSDETYLVSQAQSDITRPDWSVNSISVAVVLNKQALGEVSPDQVKAVIAGAFAYPVNVDVMAVPFKAGTASQLTEGLLVAADPISRAVLEALAAAALLFGAAIPLSGWIGRLSVNSFQPALPRQAEISLPKRDFKKLRNIATEEPSLIAKLLQSWTENDG
jgi:flagellar M-ring protein FliF